MQKAVMLHTEEEYLHFYCGAFALMLPLRRITKIDFYSASACAQQEHALPCIDLRIALGIPAEILRPPGHLITLRDEKMLQALAVIAIDNIEGFITPQAHEWHHAHGINKHLDLFFDRLYVNKKNNALTLSLSDPKQWLDCTLNTAVLQENYHAY